MTFLQLTRPDHQPPERRDLAHRVTQELIALKSYVFPAPKQEKEEPIFTPEPSNGSVKDTGDTLNDLLRKAFSYPCEDCADTTPWHYCDACKAEYEKREKEKDDRRRTKHRKWYKERKLRRKRWQTPETCAVCGNKLEKRADAKCCTVACRQKLYRQRKAGMTDKEPTEKQVARKKERDRKARIKLKWKTLWSLPKGSKVIVNGDGNRRYPPGTRLEITGWWGWKISLKTDGEKYGRDFSSRDIDAYDIVPEQK